jgi:hypothetical protein
MLFLTHSEHPSLLRIKLALCDWVQHWCFPDFGEPGRIHKRSASSNVGIMLNCTYCESPALSNEGRASESDGPKKIPLYGITPFWQTRPP